MSYTTTWINLPLSIWKCINWVRWRLLGSLSFSRRNLVKIVRLYLYDVSTERLFNLRHLHFLVVDNGSVVVTCHFLPSVLCRAAYRLLTYSNIYVIDVDTTWKDDCEWLKYINWVHWGLVVKVEVHFLLERLFHFLEENKENYNTLSHTMLTSSISSRLFVSIRTIFLPSAFSICSICDHVFLSWTKLTEIPFLPKRPVRPNHNPAACQQKHRTCCGTNQYGEYRFRYPAFHHHLWCARSSEEDHSWPPCWLEGCQSLEL